MTAPEMQGPAKVCVDFNDMDLDGRFVVSPQDSDRLVALGMSVLLWDAEGNTARGRVVNLRQRGRAVVEMLPGTWQRATVENLSAPTRPMTETAAVMLPGDLPDGELRMLFGELKAQWVADTRIESSVHQMVLHPAYQRIIGLGPRVVPLMLEDLAEGPDHWFMALVAIVGDDKATGEVTVPGAAQKWLEWGYSTGLMVRPDKPAA